jgi:hypothetical protein
MECDPAERFDLVMVACPLRSVPVPIDTVPSLKVTVPLGVPEETGLTVAVNVTVPPNAAGFAEETRLVEVPVELLLVMFCVSTAEALPVKLASPP